MSKIVEDLFNIMSSWNESIHHCNWIGITCNIFVGRVVHLSLEQLGVGGTLTPFISNLTFLNTLNLLNNSFHGEFPHEVGRLFYLQHLNFSYNNFGGSLPSNLSHCTKLEVLATGANNLTVPSSIYNISSLYYFTFTQNHLHGNLPADVGFTLPNIKVFAGAVNNLIGFVPASLLNNASKLEILDFSLNGLTGTLPKNLRVLNSSNGIHGNIPVGIGNLANLTLIALEGNRLTDSLPYSLGTLPAQVSKLHSLGELMLSENNFSGVIPSSLGRCISLEKLHLDGNSFEGNIPQTLQNLRAFLDIDRSRNTCLVPMKSRRLVASRE
ncbi:unnamed protein product [Sphenostylis stenocarpa]|uniref:Leucine-rich repeat-containing N-terminal plant-type domain-containing protein n=1 Tax=Sphenostylis stenocarpa TaxID=92480 RepID=A0AA86RZE3_9FABA|nr:unnamed protein product [Sphenostylis stenocarpa]